MTLSTEHTVCEPQWIYESSPEDARVYLDKINSNYNIRISEAYDRGGGVGVVCFSESSPLVSSPGVFAVLRGQCPCDRCNGEAFSDFMWRYRDPPVVAEAWLSSLSAGLMSARFGRFTALAALTLPTWVTTQHLQAQRSHRGHAVRGCGCLERLVLEVPASGRMEAMFF